MKKQYLEKLLVIGIEDDQHRLHDIQILDDTNDLSYQYTEVCEL